jgi:uncharacterized damage-inducible protein DinB
MENKFAQIFIADIRRRLFDESLVRIHTCLDTLTEEEVWYRPNINSNSIGNLILHLNGNIRQWILTGLGKYQDNRKRQLEFDEQGPIPKADLLHRFDSTFNDVSGVLDDLETEILTKKIIVQGFNETGISILIHVAEHLSYHTGQITYITKMLKNKDLNYYGDKNLDAVQN